jgi:hypothetical protein
MFIYVIRIRDFLTVHKQTRVSVFSENDNTAADSDLTLHQHFSTRRSQYIIAMDNNLISSDEEDDMDLLLQDTIDDDPNGK